MRALLLPRGVDGFRVDAIDYAMHDPALTDNPPAVLRQSCYAPIDFRRAVITSRMRTSFKFIERNPRASGQIRRPVYVAEVGGEGGGWPWTLFTRGPGDSNRRTESIFGSGVVLTAVTAR